MRKSFPKRKKLLLLLVVSFVMVILFHPFHLFSEQGEQGEKMQQEFIPSSSINRTSAAEMYKTASRIMKNPYAIGMGTPRELEELTNDELKKRVETLVCMGEEKGLDNIHVVIQSYETKTGLFVALCETNDIIIEKYIPNNAWLVSLPVRNINEFADSFEDSADRIIRNIIIPGYNEKVHKTIKNGEIHTFTEENNTHLIISTYKDVEQEKVEMLLKNMGCHIISHFRRISAFAVQIPEEGYKEVITMLAENEMIYRIAPDPIPVDDNDGARSVTGVDTVQNYNAGSDIFYGLTGDGVGILVYETGTVDDSHTDFAGRATVICSPQMSSHATHVAGTALGDGASIPTRDYRGMAPESRLVSGCDDMTLYEDAVTSYLTHIITNSWHSAGSAEYDTNCEYVDDLINNGLLVGADMVYPVITWSAGNARNDGDVGDNPRNIDNNYRSIDGGGKNAKNVIVVGATDDNDDMTQYSGWGPRSDGSVAPTVVAPGDEIYSCIPGGYDEKSGTSMSTPCVAGIAALMIEEIWNTQGTGYELHPGTIKAIMANTATDLGNPGPDYAYGYGRVNADKAIQTITNNNYFTDDINTGGTEETIISVPGGQTYFTVTLAWDDPAGDASLDSSISQLVNDLDLELESPSGDLYYPFVLDPGNPQDVAYSGTDDLNNIEQIEVLYPEDGDWIFRVTCGTISGSQYFSGTFDYGTTSPVTAAVPLHFSTITEALATCQDGDTIMVFAGEYTGGPYILKPDMNFIGQDADNVTIRTPGNVGIIANDGCTIRGFTITECTKGIIVLENAEVQVENIIISNCITGIRGLINSTTGLTNNTISDNGAGLEIYHGSLLNNIISHNNAGLVYLSVCTLTEDYNCFFNNSIQDYPAFHTVGTNTYCTATTPISPLYHVHMPGLKDYALRYNSPCRNAGNPDPAYYNTDETQNDIGAYGGPNGKRILPIAQVVDDELTVGLGRTFSLYDTGSYDIHGEDIVYYEWDVISAPCAVTITDPNSTMAYFTPAMVGDYVFTLTVKNARHRFSAPVEITFHVQNGNTIIVDQGGGGDYTTITDAVNAASGGDTIYIMAGTYTETEIGIIKPHLTIMGEDPQTTIVDGTGGYYVFYAYTEADSGYVGDYAVIEGLTLKNAIWNIKTNAYDVLIQHNIIMTATSNNIYQTYFEWAQSTVNNNIIVDCGSYGVSGYSGCYDICNNIIHSAGYAGVYVSTYISDVCIKNNIIANTSYGVYTTGTFTGSLTAQYNYFQNVSNTSYVSSDPNDGNLFDDIDPSSPQYVSDPSFVAFSDDGDFTNDDFHLQSGSGLENMGDPDSSFNDDFDGSRNDIGAYGGPAATW